MQRLIGKSTLFVSILFVCSCVNALICPKTFTQIRAGMTLDQVLNACGEPTSKQEKDDVLYSAEKIEYWSYLRLQPVGYNDTPRPEMSFGIEKDKVVSITVGGQTMNSTLACGGYNVKVGDSSAAVSGACGYPSSTQEGTSRKGGDYIKTNVWMYKFDEYRPAVTLTFQKGVLTSISE